MLNPELKLIQEVQQKYTTMLMEKKQVVGVSIGMVHACGRAEDEYGLIVLIDDNMPADTLNANDVIPTELDGVPVRTQAIGDLKAQDVGH